MYMCVCVCVCVCVCACSCVHARVHVCISICVCAYVCTCVCANVCANVQVCQLFQGISRHVSSGENVYPTASKSVMAYLFKLKGILTQSSGCARPLRWS